jgi:lipopolysaccharide biosynthesis glycosyltransferase
MIIVLAADNNFAQHCGVAMISILSNNSNVVFYLLTEGLDSNNVTILNELVLTNGGKLEILKVSSEIVKKFPMSKMASSHISIATYYRLFIASLLPKDIKKVIYLDCDIVVTGSLDELWSTSIDGYALGAVYQDFGWSDHEKSWTRLGIPRENGYFNAGGLIMNLDYLRSDDFENKALLFIDKNLEKIVSHDQDVLNALYYGRTKAISCKWNYTPLFMRNNIKREEFPNNFDYVREVYSKSFKPIVIHFISKPKPWQYGCSHKYKSEYYKYLSKTIWQDFKPKFNLKRYINDFMIVKIKIYIKYIDKFKIIENVKRYF